MLDAELASDAEAEVAVAAADTDDPVAEVVGIVADADATEVVTDAVAEDIDDAAPFSLFLLPALYTNVLSGVTSVGDSDLLANPTCCVSILYTE